MITITLLAFEGCLSSSISNLIDGFAVANLCHRALSGTGSDLFKTQVITAGGRPVTCCNCIRIEPQLSMDSCTATDYLIIPAMVPVPDANVLKEQESLAYIHRQYHRGTTVASVCTGAFLLAETGLLDGKMATTNWQFEKKFRYRHPRVDLRIGEIVTEQDNLMCSGAVTAMMHLALRIIQREGSARLASSCAKAMLVDPNSESQAPYTTFSRQEHHRDTRIQEAERYLRDNLPGNISIDQVASHVCLSPRHFKRRFRQATGESPLQYLQKLRIQVAKDQLENSLDTIEEITQKVGYGNTSTFRRLFKRHTSLSPREYRDRFLLLERTPHRL